jgi:hypothetical protein
MQDETTFELLNRLRSQTQYNDPFLLLKRTMETDSIFNLQRDGALHSDPMLE